MLLVKGSFFPRRKWKEDERTLKVLLIGTTTKFSKLKCYMSSFTFTKEIFDGKRNFCALEVSIRHSHHFPETSAI